MAGIYFKNLTLSFYSETKFFWLIDAEKYLGYFEKLKMMFCFDPVHIF